jgi:hypothetical protein
MLRFALERSLMLKRWRAERALHGRDLASCHCSRGMGTMRKHRPHESHPSSSCGLCAALRQEARLARRRTRYGARLAVAEGLSEVAPLCAMLAAEESPASL